MYKRLRFHLAVPLIFSAFILVSCGNKADKTMDKIDNVVTKYESKASNKTLTTQDLQDMGEQIDSLDQEYAANGDKPETEWTASEQMRYQQLMVRMQKLAAAAAAEGLQ